MSGRTTLRGNAMNGGKVEYRGDLPNLVATNYNPLRNTSIGQPLRVKSSTVRTGSAVVSRKVRYDARNFYTHGGYTMRKPIPGGPGYGSVVPNSSFQRVNILLKMWQLIPSLFGAGYPQNLGLSTAVPQPATNLSGASGHAVMQQRPLFTRVQQVQRPRAVVQRYATRGQ